MEDQDRQRLAAAEQGLASLTARLNALAEGHLELTAEGLRFGSTRLFEKLVSGDYHLHQRDAAGVESDLTGAKSIWAVPIHDTAPTGGYVLVYNASTGKIEWTVSSTPAAHVLATTAGLGPAHTTSGLTARQVLRATGATTAAFGAIQDADLPATIARDSELHTRLHTITDVLDHSATNWRVFYSDGSAHVVELALGADGTFLQSGGASTLPEFAALVAGDIPDISATYQVVSGKDAASGYAGLDAATKLTVAQIRGLRESGGQALDMGAVADGKYLKRVGTNIVGADAGNGGGGGQDLATDTLWAAKGDLAKGTGDDAADILSIGAASTVLCSIGGTAAWSGTPQLTSIKDTAGVARVALTNALYGINISLTGGVYLVDTLGIGTLASVTAGLVIIKSFVGSAIGQDLTMTSTGAGVGVVAIGLYGSATNSTSGTGGRASGLSFQAVNSCTGATVGETTACLAQAGRNTAAESVMSVLKGYEFKIWPWAAANTTVTDAYFFCTMLDNSKAQFTNCYGFFLPDMANATGINHLLQLGPPAEPYIIVKGSGSWTPADYETPLWIGCDDPATSEQVTIGANDSGDVGFRVLQVPNL